MVAACDPLMIWQLWLTCSNDGTKPSDVTRHSLVKRLAGDHMLMLLEPIKSICEYSIKFMNFVLNKIFDITPGVFQVKTKMCTVV